MLSELALRTRKEDEGKDEGKDKGKDEGKDEGWIKERNVKITRI